MDRATDNWTLLADEFDRLLFMLRGYCWQKIQTDNNTLEFPGLHVSRERAEALLAQPLNPFETDTHQPLLSVSDSQLDSAAQAWADMEQLIAEAHKAALMPQRFDILKAACTLNTFESTVVLLALGAAISPEIGTLLAYYQGDANATQPTVGLVIDWMRSGPAGLGTARATFDAFAPLQRFRLIEPLNPHAPLRNQPLRLSERVTQYLLEVDELDGALRPFCTRHLPNPAHFEATHPLLETLSEQSEQTRYVYLHGPYGSGRLALAQLLTSVQHQPLIEVDALYLAQHPDQLDELLALLRRELRLQQGALFIRDAHLLLLQPELESTPLLHLMKHIDAGPTVIYCGAEQAWQPRGELSSRDFFSWECPTPTASEREDVWGEIVDPARMSETLDVAEIASRFRFTAGRIRDTWHSAVTQASLRSRATGVTQLDLYRAAHHQSVHQLGELAQLIRPVHTLDDLILTDEPLEQLKELTNRAKYLHKVYDEWGFGNKLSTNRGIVALFTGPSGTGKTMAASIIARELGLEMYRVDLSAVVSKYIGETEKNLSRIFDEAWRSNAILFFDEADALFGKRSEVRDSHDRYANIEVNYLLQRIDTYDGIAILATNLGQNIDDAFQRRIQFTITFPEADMAVRYGIWTTIWPEETPLAEDVNFRYLAGQFKLNGGNIRNIALQSAFLAAPAGESVTMQHILQAVLSELRKEGKLISRADFGEPYASLLSLD